MRSRRASSFDDVVLSSVADSSGKLHLMDHLQTSSGSNGNGVTVLSDCGVSDSTGRCPLLGQLLQMYSLSELVALSRNVNVGVI